MHKFPNSRFLFSKLTSDTKSSEVSALIQEILPHNPRVQISSKNYYLYYDEMEGLFFGRKIIGHPSQIKAPLFYKDFGGETVESFKVGDFSLFDLSFSRFQELKTSWEQKFDHKIQKMILQINIDSLEMSYKLDIFVE